MCWKKRWIQFKDKPYKLLYYKRCVSCSVFIKLTDSCWCCLTCSSRFLQTALGLIKIPVFCNRPNFDVRCSLKLTLCWVSAVQFIYYSLAFFFFWARWVTVVGQERHPVPVHTVRTCCEFRSTYLCFCPGTSYLPRSIWNASRTGPPGIVYFPPTNLLQAYCLFPLPSEFLGAHKRSHRRMVTFHSSISWVIWHLRHSTKR